MAQKIVNNHPLVFIAAELKDEKVVAGTVQPFRFRNLAMSGANAQADVENKWQYITIMRNPKEQ